MSDYPDDDHYDDEMDGIPCPRCDGWGIVSCHCGGDLCVCDNYGDATCPLCMGDGTVSHAREQQYLDARQKWWDDYKTAVDSVKARKDRQTPAQSTSKRSQIKAARKQNRRRKR